MKGAGAEGIVSSIGQLDLVASSEKAWMGGYIPPEHLFEMKKSVGDGSGDTGVDGD